MKQIPMKKLLPALALSCGAVGAVARLGMYGFADGLLPAAHPLDILCWVITGLLAVTVTASVLRLKESKEFRKSFPHRVYGLIPGILAALGLLVTLIQGLRLASKLHTLWMILGFAAIFCLVWIGWLREQGKQPPSWPHSLVTVFFAAHLVCRYQSWSASPQVPDYSFQLLACVCLILSHYHRAAFSAGLGSRRRHLLFTLMGICLCVMCSVGCEFPWLYLSQSLLLLSELYPRKRGNTP